MPGDRRERLLAALGAIDGDDRPIERLCRAAPGIVGVSGACIILMSKQATGSVIAASNPAAVDSEDLQFALGEGPCARAFRTGAPVLEPDLSRCRHDWPVFAGEAMARGVRAVFALPLQLGAIGLGVLYLYRASPGMPSSDQSADAFVLAEIAMIMLIDEQATAPPGDPHSALDAGWVHRAVVHQATGMASVQLASTLADALARLRAHAFATERSIYDVAGDVVHGRLRFEG